MGFVVTLLLTLASFALADSHPTIASTLEKNAIPTITIKEPPLHEMQPLDATPLSQTPMFFVTRFAFRGNEALSDAQLRKVVKHFENQHLTTPQLLDAADAITAFYRDQGFINAYAYVFKSDLSPVGVVTITIRASEHEKHRANPDRLSLENPLK